MLRVPTSSRPQGALNMASLPQPQVSPPSTLKRRGGFLACRYHPKVAVIGRGGGRRAWRWSGACCSMRSSSAESKSREGGAGMTGGYDEWGGGAMTLYDLLGISRDVTLTEVKAAYRQLARRYHPDVCSADERESCTRKFMEVQEAYETLSDPMRRAMYDHHLLHPPSARRAGLGERRSWQRGRRPWEALRHGFQSLEEQEEAKQQWRPQWEGQLQGLKERAAMRQAQRAAPQQ